MSIERLNAVIDQLYAALRAITEARSLGAITDTGTANELSVLRLLNANQASTITNLLDQVRDLEERLRATKGAATKAQRKTTQLDAPGPAAP